MRAKAAGVLLLGALALVAVATACGSNSARPYKAKATYNCLKKRPGVVIPKTGGPIPGLPPPHGFTLFGPLVFGSKVGELGKTGGPGAKIVALFEGPGYADVALYMFDTVSGARATYRLQLTERIAPSFLRQGTKLTRNVFIIWGGAEDSHPGDSEIRSIILGCLRTA